MNYPVDPAFAPVIPTPPTPEFPSGHAIHGEAILEVLRRTRGGGAAAPTKAAAQAADALDATVTSPVPLPVVKEQLPQRQRRRRGLQGGAAGAAPLTPQGETAPVTRSYKTLSEASEQLAASRVRAGLHYQFTAEISVEVGQAVANKVYSGFDEKYTAIKM